MICVICMLYNTIYIYTWCVWYVWYIIWYHLHNMIHGNTYIYIYIHVYLCQDPKFSGAKPSFLPVRPPFFHMDRHISISLTRSPVKKRRFFPGKVRPTNGKCHPLPCWIGGCRSHSDVMENISIQKFTIYKLPSGNLASGKSPFFSWLNRLWPWAI